MNFTGKVVIVTGGGNGIGRELVLELLRRNVKGVVAVDVNDQSLAETTGLASALGAHDKLQTFAVDITDLGAVTSLPEKVFARFGAADVLINCAGIIQPFVRVNELDDAAIDRVFNVNFWGTMHMTRVFLPHLLQRPSAQIANFSSMGGFLPVPGQTMYGASKAAVKLMTEGLAAELSGTNVQVSVIFPGAVATNISANSGVKMNAVRLDDARAKKMAARTLAPAKAAEIILNGLELGRSRILVGKDARLMDLLYRLNPERATRFITRQMKSLLGT